MEQVFVISEADLLRLAQLTIAVAIGWAAYIVMYNRTRADYLREDLFTIRDDLFDYMWQNNVSYDCPAYTYMRNMLNGAIRFADAINLATILLAIHMRRGQARSRLSDAVDAIEDPSAREHFVKVYARVRKRIFKYIFLEGPQCFFIKPVLWIGRRFGFDSNHSGPEEWFVEKLVMLGAKRSPEARILIRELQLFGAWRRPA